jgi:hypothetical protein
MAPELVRLCSLLFRSMRYRQPDPIAELVVRTGRSNELGDDTIDL